jgi:sarcosine oxidase
MGSAALYHLARRGARAIGFDRYSPPHALGSTHGLSRIIREAYFEDPLYVPLVQRAYELWAELERGAERRLFQQTGGLMIGPADGTLVGGARRSAEAHHLEYEELTSREVRSRFPAFRVPRGVAALFERRAGMLDPEGCVAAHLALARAAGASVRLGEPVKHWSASGGKVTVETAEGKLGASHLVLCVGAWAPVLLGDGTIPLTVERQTMHWFTPARAAERFTPQHCPIAMIEYAPDHFFYTLPDSGSGVKAALHHGGELADPESVRRTVDDTDIAPVEALVRRYLPDAAGHRRASAVCLYTNTPDQHFLIDALPQHPEVLVVSACSGHGFKFASAIGEAVADLVAGRQPVCDLGAFTYARRLRTAALG